jgi:phosphoglycolate phosphatase
MPRALVFDLDGTLVDSRADIAASTNAMLRALGRAELPLSSILTMIGDGSRALVTRALTATGEPPTAEAVDAAYADFARRYEAEPAARTTLLPGAREVLDCGLPCAVVTNKPRAITLLVLEALGIDKRLKAVWGGDDGPLKPDPTGVKRVLEAMRVAAHDAWVIGDGPQDVLAGRAAGCFTVAVPGIAERERVLATHPDLVVTSLRDVVTELRALAR